MMLNGDGLKIELVRGDKPRSGELSMWCRRICRVLLIMG